MFLFCHTILLAAYFSASKNLLINFFISLFCLLLITVLDLLLIPRFGIEGAAWAQTVAYGASGIASLLVFSIREKVDLNRLLIPGRADLLAVKGLFLNT
jgi:Na+-driven multidrug efflux pump